MNNLTEIPSDLNPWDETRKAYDSQVKENERLVHRQGSLIGTIGIMSVVLLIITGLLYQKNIRCEMLTTMVLHKDSVITYERDMQLYIGEHNGYVKAK